jgi:hypothetical protein
MVGSDLALNICADYSGKRYGFVLDYMPGAGTQVGNFWKMNLSSFSEQ